MESAKQKALAEIQGKLEAMSMAELRAIASSSDIPIPRKKHELVENIMAGIENGALWVPGYEDALGFGPGPGDGSVPTPDSRYSVKVLRIMQAKAEGREL
jgi:hypothetical protein